MTASQKLFSFRFPKRQLIRTFSLSLAIGLTGTVVIPANAQEAAYPLQMSSSRTIHRPEVPGPNGLVTAGHPLASMSGLKILMDGGNAVDASVAVLATLNVVRPQMSGAGGNGFATYYDAATDKVWSLSATGAAPLALDAAPLEPEQLNKGIHAGAVPGLFGGWISMLQKYGTKSLAEVLAPAIEYAEKGHPLEASVSKAISYDEELYRTIPTSADMLLPGGKVPAAGELFYMKDLAATFKKVTAAEATALAQGKSRTEALQAAFDRFYKGDIAKEMARFYQQNGGEFTEEDFAAYQPQWVNPVHVNYRGYDIYTSTPTSRGGLEVAMQLKLVEAFDLSQYAPDDPRVTHILAEAIKLAKSDVYHFVADPNKFTIPLEGLLSDEYIASRVSLLKPAEAMIFPDHGEPPGNAQSSAYLASLDGPLLVDASREKSFAGSTTSFSVMDKAGNVVAMTPTHGGAFGTGVVVGSTGLTFNNGTRVGSTSPYPDDINYARGGQIPILNNSPVIVMKDGKFLMAFGTPGGETIGQTQFQVLVNVLDFGMGVQEAIEAPRFSIFAEPNFYKPGAKITMRIEDRIPVAQFEGLKERGHDVTLAPSYSLGSIQAILRHQTFGTVTAGADPRRAAYAVGW
ncbi:gamma-glutamyltransferase family protein [Alteromonas sp. RKMC-009]|uniref:gamma-glutamyltransferase family protein n=1 Tax=Alteromonas sp. RKMC-009 TaxID=2267264 RepID=UPI000E678B92|nr:gamma-glutamyltransferase family protein [Alteromonas sp. RKMC-009]AYA64854.1 gamma-glutamyltransferase family protein [Alteromonas sp. RKMC-009]